MRQPLRPIQCSESWLPCLRGRLAGAARSPADLHLPPSLSLCQEILCLPGFLPFGVGVLRQVHKLTVVLGRLLTISSSICGTGNSQERTVTVGGLLESSLELAQRGSGLAHLKQQFGK